MTAPVLCGCGHAHFSGDQCWCGCAYFAPPTVLDDDDEWPVGQVVG